MPLNPGNCGLSPQEDYSYIQARHYEPGNWVTIRWQEQSFAVVDKDFAAFLWAVKDGAIRPATSPRNSTWVAFEIAESHPRTEVAYHRLKIFHVPRIVWERFVEAVRADAFSSLFHSDAAEKGWVGGVAGAAYQDQSEPNDQPGTATSAMDISS